MSEYENKANILLEKLASYSSYIFNYGNEITLLELYTKALYEYKHLNDHINFNNCFNKAINLANKLNITDSKVLLLTLYLENNISLIDKNNLIDKITINNYSEILSEIHRSRYNYGAEGNIYYKLYKLNDDEVSKLKYATKAIEAYNIGYLTSTCKYKELDQYIKSIKID
jgi:hypothetical protein